MAAYRADIQNLRDPKQQNAMLDSTGLVAALGQPL